MTTLVRRTSRLHFVQPQSKYPGDIPDRVPRRRSGRLSLPLWFPFARTRTPQRAHA